MPQPSIPIGWRTGPGSRSIATLLLETLSVRGRSAEHARALRALGLGEEGLADASPWLADDAIGKLFAAAGVDEALARSIGHRLVQPDATGMLLYGLGLATPEKAYRRIETLLPRESRLSHWSIQSIGEGRATLSFRPQRGAKTPRPTLVALCALRRGMLEAIPAVYGLLPARISQTTCVADGDAACGYEATWRREERRGLIGGVAVGAGAGLGLLAIPALLGVGTLASPALWAAAITAWVAPAAVGRCLDLSRQLEAVAGARRGQLALLDQTDDLLASKIDALARVEARLEGPAVPTRRPVAIDRGGDDRPDGPLGEREREEGEAGDGAVAVSQGTSRTAALEIFAAAGKLAHALADRSRSHESVDDATPQTLVREIREWAARIAGEGAPGDIGGRRLSLGGLVESAVASLPPSLRTSAAIRLQVEPGLPAVACDPIQMEQVIAQLVSNAVEASSGILEHPEVVVSVRPARGGVELAVDDRGVGIDSSEIDEVFDPFFGEAPAGAQAGAGLPRCLAIVERHGGELRIETGERSGTRVSVLLPAAEERPPHRPEV